MTHQKSGVKSGLKIENQKNFLIKSAFYITVALFLFLALKLISGPLLPFTLAALITVLLQRGVRKWSAKLKLKKKAASVFAVLAVYAIVGGLVTWIGYALYKQLLRFASNLPQYAEQVFGVFENLSDKFNSIFGKDLGLGDSIIGDLSNMTAESIAGGIADIVASFVGGIASKIPIFILSVVIMIVASTYLAKDYDEICNFLMKKLPASVSSVLIDVKNDILTSVSGMFKGYALIMLMTFVELVVGLTLVGSEYAFMIAAITAIVDILPIFGSGTVLIPWAVFSALFGNYKKALGLAAIYLIITAVRNFAEPKIIGAEVGVHPLVMLASVFLGLSLFGAAGIVVLPLAVIVGKRILERKNANNG